MFSYTAEVRRVIDGDTLDIVIDLGLGIFHSCRVRLFGINAPETYGVEKDSSEGRRGKEATEYVMSNCQGRSVRVRTIKDKKGKYGRYLAIIFFRTGETWRNLNQQLVELQMAAPDENYQKAIAESHEI